MKALRAAVCVGCCGTVLWVASRSVPAALRAEWYREWRGELWYARREFAKRAGLTEQWKLLRFCWGAVEDAGALRAERGAVAGVNAVRGSARECLSLLMAALAISLGCGLLLPQVRGKMAPTFTRDAQDLMLIENSSAAEHGIPMLTREQYLTWAGRQQRIFESFAFYQVRSERLAGLVQRDRVRVGYATANLFDVLRGSVKRVGSSSEGGLREVVVSPELWRSLADGAAEESAPVLRIGSEIFAVGGVASAAASALPGHPQAWVLGDAALPLEAKGFVLGRVNPGFHEAAWGDRWQMSAPEPDGSPSDFTCLSLGQALRQPWQVCVFAVLLALLALPATTSLPLGEYPSRAESLRVGDGVRRWGFLLGKMGLVLLMAYCASMDLAFADPGLGVHHAEYIQLLASFTLCLWGMRWTLRDQRQRCPVCLSKLSHPARVGQPSWSFLAWNGTELICAGGHGLMHVPELETSWFSTQRWLALDGSWQVLFAPSHAGVGAP